MLQSGEWQIEEYAMKLGPIPKGPLEWLLLRPHVVPQPLIDTQLAYTLARVVMVGARLGIFDAAD
jgi:hypothetical protein